MDKLLEALESTDNLSKILILIGAIAVIGLIGYLIGYTIL